MDEQKYIVIGNFKGKEVREEVNAYSTKQAKFKATFNLGIHGTEASEFIKSNKIRVVRK